MNKKFILLMSAAIFSFSIISESLAVIIASGDNCAANDGKSTCHWEIDSEGKLTISGEGKMANWSRPNYVPWYNYQSTTTKVIVEQGITSIGSRAFAGNHSTSITLPEGITSIGNFVFNGVNNLSELIIPDSLDGGIFIANTNASTFMKSCFLPVSHPNRPSTCPADTKIVCQGDEAKCQTALSIFFPNGAACVTGDYKCIDPERVVPASNQKQCNSATYYWTGESCAHVGENGALTCAEGYIDKGTYCAELVCSNGQVKYKGQCLDEYPFAKKHWTPAEAAQWLNDDDNTVTLTFKK